MWFYRFHLIVPAADQSGANALMADLGPDYEGSFADPNVSDDGTPEGNLGIYVSFAATTQLRNDLLNLLLDWAGYGLSAQPLFWLIRFSDSQLLDSNISAEAVGQSWDEGATFAAAGVQWIQWPD